MTAYPKQARFFYSERQAWLSKQWGDELNTVTLILDGVETTTEYTECRSFGYETPDEEILAYEPAACNESVYLGQTSFANVRIGRKPSLLNVQDTDWLEKYLRILKAEEKAPWKESI